MHRQTGELVVQEGPQPSQITQQHLLSAACCRRCEELKLRPSHDIAAKVHKRTLAAPHMTLLVDDTCLCARFGNVLAQTSWYTAQKSSFLEKNPHSGSLCGPKKIHVRYQVLTGEPALTSCDLPKEVYCHFIFARAIICQLWRALCG